MPTLQDVAKRAGVSTATVSKVLSNTPYVSDKTRAKVMQAIHELGYRPNLAARALSSGKTNIIAVVFPYIYDAIFKDPLVMNILEGVENICRKQHYALLLSTPRLHTDGIDENYVQLLQSGYVDGVIVIDNVESISFAAEAHKMNIPCVVLGYHEASYSVRSNDEAGGYLMMRQVLQCSHEHIGFITVPGEMNIAIAHRLRGIKRALAESKLEFERLALVQSDFSVDGGTQAAQQLLRMQPDLTAIVSLNDRMAIGAMRYLQDIHKRVPDDISVTGYDNIASSVVSNPPLTTIDQRAVMLGQKATRLLFAVLEGHKPSSVVLSPELVKRDSLAARR